MKRTKKWTAWILACALICTCFPTWGVQAKAAGMENVALNKNVTSSGLEVAGSWTEDKVVDGIWNTDDSRWSAAQMKQSDTTEESAQTPQWLVIDLQADTTQVEQIKVHFYKKVWAAKYRIQTRASDTDSWEDVGTPVSRSSSDEQGPVDEFTDIPRLKRYVRFYFEKVNVKAAGVSVSVLEIEILGTQSGELPPTADNAQQAANMMGNLEPITEEDTQVGLPEVAAGFTVKVIGSDVPGVITDDGRITDQNIGDRTVNLVLEVTKDADESDRASKAAVVVVPDKTGKNPGLYPEVAQPNGEPDVLPSLQEWYGYEGVLTLDAESRILYADQANVGLDDVAAQMQEEMKEISGLILETQQVADEGSVGDKDIFIASTKEDGYDTGEEGYFMTINDGIRIYSSTKTGAMYGTVTAEQILWQAEGHRQLPKGVIRDFPNYEIRGVMMDIARMPHRLQYLQDYTKILKWYKLNEFHLHLNDNYWSETEGGRSGKPEDWEDIEATHRLESDVFPGLRPNTKKGEQFDYYNNVYGEAYYTKDEYRDLQRLAQSKGIDVLSEIDTPCHSAAYTKYAYDNPDQIDWLGPIQNPGCFDLISINTNASNQEEKENAVRARRFMKELLEEYIAGDDPVFLGDTVHIGTDEYDFKAGNQEAFRQYINYISKIVKDNGKKVRMWGALSVFPGSTEIAKDIVLDEWATYEDDPIARMEEGYSVVNYPQPYFYTTPGRWHKDMVNEQYLYENWDPTIFNISGNKVAMKGDPKLLGAKTGLWGDEAREGIIEADLHERALRAAALMSEKTWGGTSEDQTFTKYEQKFDGLREGPGTEIAMTIPSESEVVLDYQFENNSESDGKLVIHDASGNGYDGVVSQGSIETRDGAAYLKLDGTTKLTTPLKSLRYPYTVSFDVEADEENEAGAILFDGYDGRLSILDDEGNLGINRSFYQQQTGYRLYKGQTHRITVVGTYQTTKIYVDGVFSNMLYSTDSGSLTGDFFSSFVFPLERIGEHFKGYLGNIKVYNKALTPQELGNASVKNVNAALNQPAYKENGNSAYNTDQLRRNPAWKATDGDGRITGVDGVSTDPNSWWSSSDRDTDSLMVDFGKERQISSVEIQWKEGKMAASYVLQLSNDCITWEDVKTVTGNTSVTTIDELDAPRTARYLRMYGVLRSGSDYGIQEIKAYESVDKQSLRAALREAKKRMDGGNTEAELEQAYLAGSRVSENVLAGKAETEQAFEVLKSAMPGYEQGCTCSIDDILFPGAQIMVRTDQNGNVQKKSFPLQAQADVTDDCQVEGHQGQTPKYTYRVVQGEEIASITGDGQLEITGLGSIQVQVTVSYAGAEPAVKTAFFTAYVPEYIKAEGLTAKADSEENKEPDGPGSYAVDGDESTFWHSNYSDESKKPDFTNDVRTGIAFDLGSTLRVGKLEYVPRSNINGRILEYKLYYSQTEAGDDFVEIPGGSGTWESNVSKKTAEFEPVIARRIYLKAVQTDGNVKNSFISAAEVYIYEKPMTEPVDPEKVTVTVQAQEGGTVSGGGAVEKGSTVRVTAKADTGYTFQGWYQGEEQLSELASFDYKAETDVTLTAHFMKESPLPEKVTVTVQAQEGGTVSGGGAVEKGSTVRVTAKADTGYTFQGWYQEEKLLSGQASFDYKAESDTILTARFVKNKPPMPEKVTVTVQAQEGGTVSGGGTVEKGSQVTLTASAKAGYQFIGWYQQDKKVSDRSTWQFAAGASAVYTAKFQKSASVITPLPAPQKLKAGSITTGGMKISWKKVEGAASYRLYRYNSAKKAWEKVKTVSGTSATVRKLKTAAVYKYMVRACRLGGQEGARSKVLTTATSPAKPKVRAKRTGNKVQLRWNRRTKADGFQVLWKMAKGKYKKVQISNKKASSWKKGGLKKGKTYYFKVRGYKKVGRAKVYGSYSKWTRVHIPK